MRTLLIILFSEDMGGCQPPLDNTKPLELNMWGMTQLWRAFHHC